MSRTLLESWQEFVVLTIPPTVPDAALEAQRRAFYAGAAALWGVFEQADAGGEDPNVVLRRVQIELKQQAEAPASRSPRSTRHG